jgi:hypothetical protein
LGRSFQWRPIRWGVDDVAMRRTPVLATLLALSLTGCSDPEPNADEELSPAATTAVDDGTEPGTRLEHGDTATLVWHPTTALTGALDLTVEAVQERRASVFDGWSVGDSMQEARPYFVSVALTNVGGSDLAGQAVPLYLRDDQGRLGAPWTVGGDFTACQSGPLPEPFEAGASTEMCLVYLAPDDARITDMVFEPAEGYDPITWTGDVMGPPKVRLRSGR